MITALATIGTVTVVVLVSASILSIAACNGDNEVTWK